MILQHSACHPRKNLSLLNGLYCRESINGQTYLEQGQFIQRLPVWVWQIPALMLLQFLSSPSRSHPRFPSNLLQTQTPLSSLNAYRLLDWTGKSKLHYPASSLAGRGTQRLYCMDLLNANPPCHQAMGTHTKLAVAFGPLLLGSVAFSKDLTMFYIFMWWFFFFLKGLYWLCLWK